MSFIIDPARGTELLIIPNALNGHVSQPFAPIAFEQKKLNGGKTVRLLNKTLKLVFYSRVEDLPKLDNTQGVYVLYKYYSKSRILEVYVGKSRDLARRQTEHADNSKKDCLTSAVIITLADNGFNESDASNLENALYLHFKRSKNVVLHNATVPSCCKSYDPEDSSVLKWSDKIVNCVLDYIFGESRTDFALKEHPTEFTYDYVKTGKSNFSIERVKGRQTFTIEAGSILCIGEKVDGNTKARYEKYIKDNKFIVLLDDISSTEEKFYRFEDSLRLKDECFKDFFKRINFQYFVNAKGETHKLII